MIRETTRCRKTGYQEPKVSRDEIQAGGMKYEFGKEDLRDKKDELDHGEN